ncbi:MAG TPA: tryptophan 7-halogenase, partial [Pirellulaceae bacterium]|nr:tryptophan 7-halogenase [Pirellulaceae bacterium]
KRIWDSTRDFLGVHYKLNKRIDNPFWRECWEKVELGAAEEIVEYYKENGPSGLWRIPLFQQTEYKSFSMEGYFAMLVGMKVPYQKTYQPTEAERQLWNGIQQQIKSAAKTAYSIEEMLQLVRSPNWQWPADTFKWPQGIGLRR